MDTNKAVYWIALGVVALALNSEYSQGSFARLHQVAARADSALCTDLDARRANSGMGDGICGVETDCQWIICWPQQTQPNQCGPRAEMLR